MNDNDDDVEAFGPSLPPSASTHPQQPTTSEVQEASDSDDDDDIGPMPASTSAADEYAARRAIFDAEQQAGAGLMREAWMTELPEKLTSYGLGARQFRRNAAPDRDAAADVWTSTPQDKAKKVICYMRSSREKYTQTTGISSGTADCADLRAEAR